MSDHDSHGYNNSETFEFVSRNTDIRQHAHTSQLPWMAHWTRATSITSLLGQEHFTVTNLIKNQIEGQFYLPVSNTMSSYNCECKNFCQHGHGKFGGSKSVPKLPACSINWENFLSHQFQNSTSSTPDPKHFPMFDIKRKIETVMDLKKRTSYDKIMAVKIHDSELAPPVIDFASAGQKIGQTDQEMIHYEHFANANITCLKHEPCNFSSRSVMVSKIKNGNPRYLESSAIKLKDTSDFPGSRKEETEMFSNATQLLLHLKEVVGGSVHAKVTGTALFEKLSLPSTLHPNSQIPVSSSENMQDVGHTNPRLFEKQNQSLVKTDMHIDVNPTPFSPEDVGSTSRSQKVPDNFKKAETDMSSRGTEVQSHVRKTSDPLTCLTQSDSEPSWKWVKRLRPNPTDPTPLDTKRLKRGDTSTGEMHNLLTRVVNYNRSISDLDKSSLLQDNSEDSVRVLRWIQRWCQHSQKKAPAQPVVLCEPENTSVLPENFEARQNTRVLPENSENFGAKQNTRVLPENFEAKQFPSLAAMALMGKQVTNFRPCEFRMKGSTVVWNN